MKRTLFRYLLLEVLGPFAIGLVILTFVLLMFQLLKLTELIVSYGVGLGDVARILLYIFPPFFTFTVPMSFLLAVLMAVSRLSSDSELTAMKAGGLSLYQLYPPILLLSLVMTLLTAGLALYADPWGKSSFKNLLLDLGRQKATIGLVEHVFNDSLDDLTIYVHHLVPEEDRLEGLFLADERQPDAPLYVIAEQGQILAGEDAAMRIEMTNGVLHRTDPADPTIYETVRFGKYRLRVDLNQTMKDGQLKRSYLEMGLGELGRHVDALRRQGDSFDMRRAWVEYHRRFAMPFACLAFGLIALPLGVSPPRSGRSRGFSTSIVMLCVFYLLFRAGENLGWKGILHPAVAMWSPIFVLLLAGAYLLAKKAGERPVWLLDVASEYGRAAARWLRRKAGLHDPEAS